MDKIIEKLDAFTFGVYLLGAGVLTATTISISKLASRFFQWAGEELGAAAITKVTHILLTPALTEIKDEVSKLKSGVKDLSDSLDRYREEKHKLEGEHLQVVQVIIDEDHEARQALKDHYKELLKKEVK